MKRAPARPLDGKPRQGHAIDGKRNEVQATQGGLDEVRPLGKRPPRDSRRVGERPHEVRPIGKRPHEVRLIGGLWKRTTLPVADRPGLRPTPSRVRETLFNWLGQDLTGWHCLDAFAGSGALGFEAASRGAAQVLLVERDAVLCAALRQVKDRLGAASVEVVCADGLSVLARGADEAHHLVLLDPPYASGLLEPALAAAVRLLRPGGFLYAEADRALVPPVGCLPHRQGRAGAVWHHLFRRCGDTDRG